MHNKAKEMLTRSSDYNNTTTINSKGKQNNIRDYKAKLRKGSTKRLLKLDIKGTTTQSKEGITRKEKMPHLEV